MRKQTHQEGVALFSALILSVVAGALMTTMVISFTGQNKANQHSQTYEKSLMVADIGIQRFITGLAHEDDGISWSRVNGMTSKPGTPPNGFWLWEWHKVKDAEGKEVGKYRVELMPVTGADANRKLRLKAYGVSYTHFEGNEPKNVTQRAVGLELERNSLGDFAIASNHELGGARINGGSTIHGGILTGGELSLDSSSTGIYNDYGELETPESGGKKRSMFSGYDRPTKDPNAEVFVYRDESSASANNGMINLASKAGFGSATNPLKGVHTANDSTALDPGDGGMDEAGDGLIGNGAGNHHNAKRDHKLPNLTFPDASMGSDFMADRKVDAGSNVFNASALDFSKDFNLGVLKYDKSKNLLEINPDSSTVYITGDITLPGPIEYKGKGGLFIEGNFTAPDGFVPEDPSKFPSEHALGVTCTGDMSLGQKSGSSTEYAGFFFGNNSINIQKANVYGNIFGNVVNMPTTGTRPTIIVHPEVMGETGVQLPEFTRFLLKKNLWWEYEGRDARSTS